MSALQGNLEIFAMPDVFRLLARSRVTGALRLVRNSGEGIVYFREGDVYFAFTSLNPERLGDRIVRAKLVSQAQFLRVLDEQRSNPAKRVGELLVEKGYVAQATLETFLRDQVQDAVFSLLQWDTGEFICEPGEQAREDVGLSENVENLLMEFSRRVEEWEVIRRKIPSFEIVPRLLAGPPSGATDINIKPEEWRLLVLVDGNRSVHDIAAAVQIEDFDAARVLYGLVGAGLVDIPAEGVSTQPQAPPAAQTSSPPSAAPPQPTPRPGYGVPPAAEAPSAGIDQSMWAAPSASPSAAAPPAAVPAPPSATPNGPPASHPRSEVPTTSSGTFDAPAPNGSPGSAPQRKQLRDPALSKEVLLRLIAGVRRL